MTGLFETMLAIGGRIVQCEEHFARLARSARELQLPAPDEEKFRAAIARAVLSHEENVSREPPLTLTLSPPLRGEGTEAAVRCIYEDGLFSATAGPIPTITLRRREGARVVTLDRSIVRDQPSHKLTSYITSRPAIPDGAEEALFVDRQGHILEGTTTNVFAVASDSLITARDAILPGIVRAWVIAHAVKVIERPPTIEELRAGSFLTSSLTLLAPIVTIDGVACAAPGREFARLRATYEARR
ncbi:MAG: aminotransferase class IV [Acidobacteriota bacterium]|nr:aminotransferase class IV [Acidobacteriota bacterium]